MRPSFMWSHKTHTRQPLPCCTLPKSHARPGEVPWRDLSLEVRAQSSGCHYDRGVIPGLDHRAWLDNMASQTLIQSICLHRWDM